MNTINILLNIILACIFCQFATISHELGHAIPALVFSKDKVRIAFGNTNAGINIKKIKIKRLCIDIGRFQPFLGFVYWNGDRLTKWQSIVCCAGGPIISLVMGISWISIAGGVSNHLVKELFFFAGYCHIGQFICTAIPIIYPKWWDGYGGSHSDGYNIFSIIKEK